MYLVLCHVTRGVGHGGTGSTVFFLNCSDQPTGQHEGHQPFERSHGPSLCTDGGTGLVARVRKVWCSTYEAERSCNKEGKRGEIAVAVSGNPTCGCLRWWLSSEDLRIRYNKPCANSSSGYSWGCGWSSSSLHADPVHVLPIKLCYSTVLMCCRRNLVNPDMQINAVYVHN